MMTTEDEDGGGGVDCNGGGGGAASGAVSSTTTKTVVKDNKSKDNNSDGVAEPVSLSQLFACAERRKSSNHKGSISPIHHLDCSIPENASAVLRAAAIENRVMGNGSSSPPFRDLKFPGSAPSKLPSSSELRALVPKLQKEVKYWEDRSSGLEAEVAELRRQISGRDAEVVRLIREVHKLRSVLQQQPHNLSPLLESPSKQNGHDNLQIPSFGKRQAVSGESSILGQTDTELQYHDKDSRSKQLIRDALLENDLLKNLDISQVKQVVNCMSPQTFTCDSFVIREGQAGAHLYVSAEGEFEVTKDGALLATMGPGKVFGELAILYNCTRTASVKVVNGDAKVWVLDRRSFQLIMLSTGMQRISDHLKFLRSVPLLQNLPNDKLARVADVLEVEFFSTGTYIVRQGASGDTFFIISKGSVKITQKLQDGEEQEIRVLGSGDYFGEQALLKTDYRTANVIALSPGVECLTLDRHSFIQLIGELSELHDKDYGDSDRVSRPGSSTSSRHDSDQDQESAFLRLNDLEVLKTLGVGGFGRVELVQSKSRSSLVYAMKRLKKQHVVDTQQQEHVMNEKKVLLSCKSPFICKLYRTFKDSKYVYFLLEACLGGEVWSLLRDRGHFDEPTTRFVTACVVQALDYLHTRNYIFRDMKPENLLLDSKGYVKLVDFGFAKRVTPGGKTWTFCGTPEYVSPEVILNKGHDRAVDYWALGILIHELLSGTPPFVNSDPMKIYGMILKGIDFTQLPRHTSRAAQNLVRRLCRDTPSERIGYQRGGLNDIRRHRWYQGFDWEGLEKCTLQSPIQRKVKGPTDTRNFDHFPNDKDTPPDEISGWDCDF